MSCTQQKRRATDLVGINGDWLIDSRGIYKQILVRVDCRCKNGWKSSRDEHLLSKISALSELEQREESEQDLPGGVVQYRCAWKEREVVSGRLERTVDMVRAVRSV